MLDFEDALAQAERARDSAAVRQALTKAVTLYRGDLLPGCYDEWILPERDRLQPEQQANAELDSNKVPSQAPGRSTARCFLLWLERIWYGP